MDVPEAKALQKALDAEKRKNHQMQLQVDDYRGFHGRHVAELASKDRRIRELESDLGKANAEIARLLIDDVSKS